MKRRAFGLVILLGFAGLSPGSPVQPVPPLSFELGAGRCLRETYLFKGGERACVIAMGPEKGSFLGLYIYDEHGNCVVWDDLGTESTKSDAAVEWFPTQTSRYMVEIRNLGLESNRVDLAVR